jgi:hypothetical protein
MSDPLTTWHDPNPRQSGGCGSLLVALVGAIMLLPGVCAIIAFTQNPKVPLPSSQMAPLFWLLLAIGAGGVAMIWAAIKWLRRG